MKTSDVSSSTSFLSLVVPVHNAAAYLEACLASVRTQSFGDWECLCVDDGSTDDSPAILAEASARDARFRIVTQAQGGVSRARNAALSRLRGTYFLFLDADDLLFPEALAALAEILRKTDADALLTPTLFEPFSDGAPPPPDRTARLAAFDELSPDDRRALVLGPQAPTGYPQGRVYRTSLFGALRFPEGVQMMEDVAYWADAVSVRARWVLARGTYYAYRLTPGSLSRSRTPRFYRSCLTVAPLTFPKITAALGLSRREAWRVWRPYQGIYAGFLRSMFLAWPTFTAEDRTALAALFKDWRAAFPFQPLSPFTRLRAWCALRGWGNGGWVDAFEIPWTQALNRLRTLKGRRRG